MRTPKAKRDPAAISAALARLNGSYALLDAHLAKSPCVAGDRFTMGDIPIGMTCYRYYDLEIARRRLPNLEAYYARLKERPAYREHVMVSYESLRATD